MNIIITYHPDNYIAWRIGSGPTVEIYDIQVRNEDRRKGFGKELVNLLLAKIRKECKGATLLWAITRAENVIAQQFYESLNFRVIGILRNFYNDTIGEDQHVVDALMYGLDLKG